MEKIKIAIGLAIIVASFVYILRNKSSMLDNLMKKSVEDYEKQKKIQDKAKDVVDGKADDYTLDLQASMGEVAFNGKALGTSYSQTPTTARRVTLTAGMGDVVLTTTE